MIEIICFAYVYITECMTICVCVWKGGILFANCCCFAVPLSLSLPLSLSCVDCTFCICLRISVEMSFVSMFVSFFTNLPMPHRRYTQKHANSISVFILFILFCFTFVRGWRLISVRTLFSLGCCCCCLTQHI